MVFCDASEHLSGEILEFDRIREATRFVETIHIEGMENDSRGRRGVKRDYIVLYEMIIEARNGGVPTQKGIDFKLPRTDTCPPEIAQLERSLSLHTSLFGFHP